MIHVYVYKFEYISNERFALIANKPYMLYVYVYVYIYIYIYIYI